MSGISAAPHEDNIRYFNVIIAGPQSSPFEGMLFCVDMLYGHAFDISFEKVFFQYFTKLVHKVL